MKEFLKSVKIRQSYCQKFGGFLFLEHSVYSIDDRFLTQSQVSGSPKLINDNDDNDDDDADADDDDGDGP